MSVCCECCVLYRQRSLRRADKSFRGVLPNVVRRCVWYNGRNLAKWEGPGLLGAVAPKPEQNWLPFMYVSSCSPLSAFVYHEWLFYCFTSRKFDLCALPSFGL